MKPRKYEITDNYAEWSLDYKRRLAKLTQMAKHRAKVKELPYDIDKEHVRKLWEDSEGCCALTGQKLCLEKWGGKGQVHPQAPSLDRIEPKLGYVKGNVRLITYHMNISLSDFGVEEFENLIRNYREIN